MTSENGGRAALAPPRRSLSIDALRVLGIVAIVLGHAVRSDVVRASTFSWHVPLFFFLSGYLWRPGRSVRDEIRRRWQTLLKPYLAWLVTLGVPFLVVLLVLRGVRGAAERGVTMLLGGTYLTAPFQAFWFATALLAANVVYRMVERAWRWSPLWLLAPLVAVADAAGPYLTRVPEAAGLGIPAIAFLILGQAARRLRPGFRSWPIGLLALSGAVVLIATGVSRPMDIKQGNYGTPVLGFIVAACICFALVIFAEAVVFKLPDMAENAIFLLAKLGLAAVLTHGVAVSALQNAVPPIFVFVLSLVFAFGVAWVASRTPWRALFLGRA